MLSMACATERDLKIDGIFMKLRLDLVTLHDRVRQGLEKGERGKRGKRGNPICVNLAYIIS